LSNIIGIIVYISANSGDPGQSDSKKSYSYGWSFYFGALSFIMAEMVGVLAVHMFIEKHRRQRAKSRTELIKKPQSAAAAFAARIPSYRYRFRRRSSCPSSEPNSSRDTSPVGKGFTGPAGAPPSAADISMYTLSRDPGKAPPGGGGGPLLNSEMEFLQGKDSDPPDFKEALQGNAANRRTTPVCVGGRGSNGGTGHPAEKTCIESELLREAQRHERVRGVEERENRGSERVRTKKRQSRVWQPQLCALPERVGGAIRASMAWLDFCLSSGLEL
ncbi:hypothetical protein JZ751_004497, partial [Albula glossodonta]